MVDTVGLNDKTYIDNFKTPHTTQLHVTERFRINPDRKGLTVDVTVEDPGAFTMAWSAVQRWKYSHARSILEEVCAENSDAFFAYDVVPIPTAGKPDF